MGHYCCITKVFTSLQNLAANLILMLLYSISPLVFLYRQQSRKLQANDVDHIEQEEEDERPSPSLVAVPVITSSGASMAIKNKLGVTKFSEYIVKTGRSDIDECTICLQRIERRQQILELSNCVHVYHIECLEGWLDQGHGTCPLCRLQVLPQPPLVDIKDPWRLERMVYLFGDDYMLQSF